jgi:hypothetical protein
MKEGRRKDIGPQITLMDAEEKLRNGRASEEKEKEFCALRPFLFGGDYGICVNLRVLRASQDSVVVGCIGFRWF